MCVMILMSVVMLSVPSMMSRRATAQGSPLGAYASGAAKPDAAAILDLDGGLQKELASMTPEERNFYVKTSPAAALAFTSLERKRERRKHFIALFKRNPALERALLYAVAAKERVIVARLTLMEYKRAIAVSLSALPSLLLVCGALMAALGRFGWSRLLGLACLRLMASLLLSVSVLSLACQMFLGLDSFYLAPGFLWIAPACGIAAASAYLRALDMNFPVWNFALRALAVPLACAAAALVWSLAIPGFI